MIVTSSNEESDIEVANLYFMANEDESTSNEVSPFYKELQDVLEYLYINFSKLVSKNTCLKNSFQS